MTDKLKGYLFSFVIFALRYCLAPFFDVHKLNA